MLPKNNLALFIALAATLILGATAIIIPASRVSLYLLLSLAMTLLSPLPIFLGRRVAAHQNYDGASAALESGYFVSAWFVTSAIVWPCFMTHLGWVKEWRSVVWVPLGVIILLGSLLCYNAVFNRDEEDDFNIY